MHECLISNLFLKNCKKVNADVKIQLQRTECLTKQFVENVVYQTIPFFTMIYIL